MGKYYICLCGLLLKESVREILADTLSFLVLIYSFAFNSSYAVLDIASLYSV